MATQTKQSPVLVIRDGALKASIWENDGENGSYLTATFARTYTKDGKPKDSQSFGRNDLLPIAELARRAYGKIGVYADSKKQEEVEKRLPEAG